MLQTTPLSIFLCLILSYGLYFLKTRFDNSKKSFSATNFLVISASNHFPIGVFILFKILEDMPEIIVRANVKLGKEASTGMLPT